MYRCCTCGSKIEDYFKPCPECECHEIEGLVNDYYFLYRDGDYVYVKNISTDKKINYKNNSETYF